MNDTTTTEIYANLVVGSVRFTCTQSTRSLRNGPFPVWITLFDEAGNRSNAIKGAIDVWWN